MTVLGTQIDSDRRLLEFENYEDYLDSLVKPTDLYYLRSTTVAREIAALGYRCTGETLDRNSFYYRLKAVRHIVFPIRRPYTLVSELTKTSDDVERELARRERPNRLGILSTIVFLRHFTEFFEISGYIDYAHRLKEGNWASFFAGKRRLWPTPKDLGYYHWRRGITCLNETDNYTPVVDPRKGLMFRNVHDRKLIIVDPSALSPGECTTRVKISSKKYEHVVLYDHVVRDNL